MEHMQYLFKVKTVKVDLNLNSRLKLNYISEENWIEMNLSGLVSSQSQFTGNWQLERFHYRNPNWI